MKPTDATRATAEAMPEINRRQMLAGVAVVPACGLAAIVPTSAIAITAHDPLIDMLEAYREGMTAFSALKEDDWPLHGGEDAVIQKTYGAPLNALNEWDQPARTREGAIAALRFIAEETRNFWSSEGVPAMAMAALAYFEQEARS
jgi:hypothetical protein